MLLRVVVLCFTLGLALTVLGCEVATDFGDGLDPAVRPQLDEEACPPCTELDSAKKSRMESASGEICSGYRSDILEAVEDGEWGQFDDPDYYGMHDRDHDDDYHYGMEVHHPGFGLPGQDGERYLAWTMLHEYVHHIYLLSEEAEHNLLYEDDGIFDTCIPWWSLLPPPPPAPPPPGGE